MSRTQSGTIRYSSLQHTTHSHSKSFLQFLSVDLTQTKVQHSRQKRQQHCIIVEVVETWVLFVPSAQIFTFLHSRSLHNLCEWILSGLVGEKFSSVAHNAGNTYCNVSNTLHASHLICFVSSNMWNFYLSVCERRHLFCF